MVSTQQGVSLSRSVKRIPCEERWGRDCLEGLKWAPWKWDHEAEDEGDLPEGVPLEERENGQLGSKVIFVDIKERQTHHFSITKRDVDQHKPAKGCAGCSSMTRSTGRQPHSVACRERFRQRLKDHARVQHNRGQAKRV